MTQEDGDGTDEQLMARIVGGDSSALRPLVERYQEPLHGYLYRMLDGDSGGAEDCVQETFRRLIKPREYDHEQLVPVTGHAAPAAMHRILRSVALAGIAAVVVLATAFAASPKVRSAVAGWFGSGLQFAPHWFWAQSTS